MALRLRVSRAPIYRHHHLLSLLPASQTLHHHHYRIRCFHSDNDTSKSFSNHRFNRVPYHRTRLRNRNQHDYINHSVPNLHRFISNSISISRPLPLSQSLIHLHHRYPFCSSSKPPSSSSTDSNQGSKTTKPSSSSSTSSTVSTTSSSSDYSKYLKYVNPVFIATKLGSLLYNMVYLTVDSLIHPKRGLDRLRSLWKSIKHHAVNFWDSTKLMWTDIKTAVKILRRFTKGKELSYRERRQLRRVALDILRFVPMLIIVLIPALELLLPAILYFFPNILPSRFQTEHMKLEKRKKLLAARIGLAVFFEDTLKEFHKETKRKQEMVGNMGNAEDQKESGNVNGLTVKEKEVRSLGKLLEAIKSGEEIGNEAILKVAALFDDEMALDNATHTVLSNMCRYMQMSNWGTTPMLRTRLYSKIRTIRREDQGIRKEGLENMPLQLLKQLLRERGMRSDFEEWVLRANMAKWLELSLDNEVPVTLLVMSRIFTLQHTPGQDATTKLKETISTIGEATTKEMLVEKGGVEDKKAEKEIIERQQQLIDEEETLKLQVEEEKKEKKERAAILSATMTAEEEEDEEAQRRMIRDVAESVESLTTDSPVDHEKHEIREIKEKIQEFKEKTAEQVTVSTTTTTVKEMMEDGDKVIAEEVLSAEEMEMVSPSIKSEEEERVEMEREFDVKEDDMEFVEGIKGEIAGREKTRQKVTDKIEKLLEKTSKKADETSTKFGNTLKSIDDLDHLTEDKFVKLLQEVLKLGYSEEQYAKFWKLYKAQREKKPDTEAWMVLEHIIDDHEDDIDMKDIGKITKEDTESEDK